MWCLLYIRLWLGMSPRNLEKEEIVIDLFKDIPDEVVERTLRNIRSNLERIDIYEGHTIRRHVDIQLEILKTRLTLRDLRYATSFYDFAIARTAIVALLKQCYEEKVENWLMSVGDDKLVLQKDFGKGIGYGYCREDMVLRENLTKLRLVLEKEAARDWGFRILTCYPVF